MPRIDIKPLSVNQCWQGRRFKTPAYKNYEEELLWKLPAMKLPKPPYSLSIEVGLSSKNADIDNVLKPLIDILQKKYDFNDKLVYSLKIKKFNVKKGKEFILFSLTSLPK